MPLFIEMRIGLRTDDLERVVDGILFWNAISTKENIPKKFCKLGTGPSNYKKNL